MAINEKQYETILAALADKLEEKDTKIEVQKWQIESLEARLADAEAEIKTLRSERKELK